MVNSPSTAKGLQHTGISSKPTVHRLNPISADSRYLQAGSPSGTRIANATTSSNKLLDVLNGIHRSSPSAPIVGTLPQEARRWENAASKAMVSRGHQVDITAKRRSKSSAIAMEGRPRSMRRRRRRMGREGCWRPVLEVWPSVQWAVR